MKKIFYTFLAIIALNTSGNSQIYNDYIGGGHSEGITVTASSVMDTSTTALKTINGSGLDNQYMEASRFLAQATVAHDPAEVDKVIQLGFEPWINDQFNKPTESVESEMNQIWHDLKVIYANNGVDTNDVFGPYAKHFNYALWTKTMTNQDLLRQRVTQALTEILVTSRNSDLGDWGEALSNYYDLIADNAFGNYYDLLNDVTKSVSMGYYLSHINNPKTDTSNNVRPDENYAREVMQLFTIGLHELNLDGSLKRDNNGNPIPTYDNTDIKELAKVFTGLGCGALENPNYWPYVPIFGVGMWAIDKTVPMQMFENDHEQGPKVILKDITIDIPNDGMAEVDSLLSYLFYHDNVAPFISYRLIQRLVKSNPSPGYISRVATKFNDNGSGVRGDLKEVIKAILLDEEARDGSYMFGEGDVGMVVPPYLRIAPFLRKIPLDNPTGKFWRNGYNFADKTLHWPLAAPSVFNFYLPSHQPIGEFLERDLVSPELKIQNTSSAISYINLCHETIYWDAWYDWENNDYINTEVDVDLEELTNLSNDIEKMINVLDKEYAHGQLTEETRSIIRTALDQIIWTSNEDWRIYRARMAIYLMLISPDYTVLK